MLAAAFASLGWAGGADATAKPVPTDDVADRVLSLGQRGAPKSPGAQKKRLANGLAPLADSPLFLGDYADPFVLAVDVDLFLYTSNTVDQTCPC